MILSGYYKMVEIKRIKSHRYDCVASTGNYEPFEKIAKCAKKERFYCYYNGVPDTFNANAQRKADCAITSNGGNISSVFVPAFASPLFGYGDTKGTNDALLFVFSENYEQIEIFVARGHKHQVKQLFSYLKDGGLNGEMDKLRKGAKPTNVECLPK